MSRVVLCLAVVMGGAGSVGAEVVRTAKQHLLLKTTKRIVFDEPYASHRRTGLSWGSGGRYVWPKVSSSWNTAQ